MMYALQPEPLRPSDAWSGGFFRCLSLTPGKASLGKTAECVADGLGEGCGLSFLFASFSLDSKEKEDEKTLTLKQTVTMSHLSSIVVLRSSDGFGVRRMTATNVRTDPQMLAARHKKERIAAPCHSPTKVLYEDESIGEYSGDILVGNTVSVERKVTRIVIAESEAQVLNSVKATDSEVGLSFVLRLNEGSNGEYSTP